MSVIIVAVPLDLFPTGKKDFAHGESVFLCVTSIATVK